MNILTTNVTLLKKRGVHFNLFSIFDTTQPPSEYFVYCLLLKGLMTTHLNPMRFKLFIYLTDSFLSLGRANTW